MFCDIGREAGHQCSAKLWGQLALALVAAGNLARRWRKPAYDASKLRRHDRQPAGQLSNKGSLSCLPAGSSWAPWYVNKECSTCPGREERVGGLQPLPKATRAQPAPRSPLPLAHSTAQPPPDSVRTLAHRCDPALHLYASAARFGPAPAPNKASAQTSLNLAPRRCAR